MKDRCLRLWQMKQSKKQQMNRIILLKGQIKKYQELYDKHKQEMGVAKSRLEWTKDQLEKAEAVMICDFCKKSIKENEPYISDRHYNYCSHDCKSDGDVAEVNALQHWESDYQDGKLQSKG